MGHDVTIDGSSYISSKRASELTGYTQDYIGQLARTGKIIARRMGGLWYVLQESIMGHKDAADAYVPVPPAQTVVADPDDPVVSFDGRTYVSAAYAAKTIRYNQDYIGQLARSGKVLSQQVGNRWYVDIDGLKRHKEEKDALLGAVQAESVGIWRPEAETKNAEMNDVREITSEKTDLHFSYISEAHPLMPVMQKSTENVSAPEVAVSDELTPLETASETHTIPIRIIRSIQNSRSEVARDLPRDSAKSRVRMPGKSIFYKGFTAFVILVAIGFVFNLTVFDASLYARFFGDRTTVAEGAPVRDSSAVQFMNSVFSRDLNFERKR